jgi:molybdate-binding protein/DNA-binding XRE family transcriptional regulator
MAQSPLTSTLRSRRSAAGLSQDGLARLVGVSRQAVVSIEAGRQVPSTTLAIQLARALRCSVEDLFDLSGADMFEVTGSSPAPRPGTRVALGRVDGRWVAHPVGIRPEAADGAVREGSAGRASLEPAASNAVRAEAFYDRSELERTVLVAGCAPLLGILGHRLSRRYSDAKGAWIPANSEQALSLLEKGLVHMAGLHLVRSDARGGHESIVRARLPNERTAIVHVMRWQQGLLVAAGNPLGIVAPRDLLRPDVRLARREAGSGAYRLTRRLLSEDARRSVPTGGPLARSHTEVATLVRSGAADVGVAIESAALEEGLDFFPLEEERFDLVMPRRRLEETPTARLLDLLAGLDFRAEAGCLAGHDLSSAGHTVSVDPA